MVFPWFPIHPRALKPGGKAIAHPRDVHQPRALRAHVHEGAEVPIGRGPKMAIPGT